MAFVWKKEGGIINDIRADEEGETRQRCKVDCLRCRLSRQDVTVRPGLLFVAMTLDGAVCMLAGLDAVAPTQQYIILLRARERGGRGRRR